MKTLVLTISLLLIGIVLISGCGLANSYYAVRSFDLNQAQSTSVGSAMVIVESGMKNDVYKWKVSGSRRELVYSGMDGNVLQVTYREYNVNQNGTFIKDGFTQHLKYDLSESDVIQFRDTKIKILNTSSSSIEYMVIDADKEIKKAPKEDITKI